MVNHCRNEPVLPLSLTAQQIYPKVHITFNSIINPGTGAPHAAVYRLSIDFIIRLLPGPIGQITHILSGKSVLLITYTESSSDTPLLRS